MALFFKKMLHDQCNRKTKEDADAKQYKGEFLDNLNFSMKNYYLAYPPEVQACLDDRLLNFQNDLRDVTKVMHKDIQIAMQWRLAFKQNTEEDEDELMELSLDTESPPTSPPGPPPTSPAVSPL